MFFSPRDTIFEAAKCGDLDAVRRFVERDGFPPVDEKDFGCQSLLTVACEAGQAEVVRFLRERSVVATYSCSYSPEAFAAMRGGHLEVLRVLCKFGLDPDNKEYSKHGDSLIDLAVEERRVEVVRLLLAHGGTIYTGHEDEITDEECENCQYPSPLELSARAGDVELVEFLLQVVMDLKGHEANYYLEKAHYHVPKYEQRQRQEAEEESQRRLSHSASVKGEDASLFCGCVVLALLGVGLLWCAYQLVSWVGKSIFG